MRAPDCAEVAASVIVCVSIAHTAAAVVAHPFVWDFSATRASVRLDAELRRRTGLRVRPHGRGRCSQQACVKKRGEQCSDAVISNRVTRLLHTCPLYAPMPLVGLRTPCALEGAFAAGIVSLAGRAGDRLWKRRRCCGSTGATWRLVFSPKSFLVASAAVAASSAAAASCGGQSARFTFYTNLFYCALDTVTFPRRSAAAQEAVPELRWRSCDVRQRLPLANAVVSGRSN